MAARSRFGGDEGLFADAYSHVVMGCRPYKNAALLTAEETTMMQRGVSGLGRAAVSAAGGRSRPISGSWPGMTLPAGVHTETGLGKMQWEATTNAR